MEKHLITEDEAKNMASALSANLYYADNFSQASFAAFCKNLPKPAFADVVFNGLEAKSNVHVRVTFGDFSFITIVFFVDDLYPLFFQWLVDCGFSEPTSYTNYFRYSSPDTLPF